MSNATIALLIFIQIVELIKSTAGVPQLLGCWRNPSLLCKNKISTNEPPSMTSSSANPKTSFQDVKIICGFCGVLLGILGVFLYTLNKRRKTLRSRKMGPEAEVIVYDEPRLLPGQIAKPPPTYEETVPDVIVNNESRLLQGQTMNLLPTYEETVPNNPELSNLVEYNRTTESSKEDDLESQPPRYSDISLDD